MEILILIVLAYLGFSMYKGHVEGDQDALEVSYGCLIPAVIGLAFILAFILPTCGGM